jgi:lipoate-protein ligase A
VIDVVCCRPTSAAIALGSRQRPELLDAAACDRAGLEITVRRSGGGAVVIEPGRTLWIDVVVPASRVPGDIRSSMVWIGEQWGRALDACLGAAPVDPPVATVRSVHRGGMVSTPWSELVCFAGFGPGEVLAGDRKLVGLSQRRTRRGARFQGMVYLASPSIDVRSLFVGAVPDGPIPPVATAGGLDASTFPAQLAAGLAAELDAELALSPGSA